MEIALVRHGQTDWNLAGKLQGQVEIPLNATGIRQAREAAVKLADERWDDIVSSSLGRAAVTADIIAEHLALSVSARYDALVERAYGEVEGWTKAEADAKYGSPWPGEETIEALEIRAAEAVDLVTRAHPVERLIIVTHGTFIRAFTDITTGLTTVTPGNAESVRFEGEPGNWRVVAGLLVA